MMRTLSRRLAPQFLAISVALLPILGGSLRAEEAGEQKARQTWSFAGFNGRYDRAQLQRGFQVYKEVCSACHGLKRIAFRNLAEPGGPAFPEDAVKALAATYKVPDVPDDQGKIKDRPAILSDYIPSPFKNEQEARAAMNGALPPDLSLIARARKYEEEYPWYTHIFVMLRDVANGYQEAGADYIYALLNGYADAPASMKMNDGMYYNKAFPGHQVAMPPPLAGGDGQVTYTDGTKPTVDNYARDVAAFLSWASDPMLETRKKTGWIVMLFVALMTLILFFAKRRLWASVH